MSKPFKRPLKNQAWRLITSGAANSYTYTDYAGISSLIVDTLETGAKIMVPLFIETGEIITVNTTDRSYGQRVN